MIHKTISAGEIRQIFNQEGYWNKAEQGEYSTKVVWQKHRSPPLSFLQVCTYSQRVAYFEEDGTKVAEVHQYYQPDGTIGASGLPDPKMLLYNGVVYSV